TPAVLTVASDPKSKVYGSSLPPLTYSVDGLVNGETTSSVLAGSLATSATTTSGVGGYPITQGTVTLTSANYTLSFTGSTLSVTPAALSVPEDAKSKVYGSAVPSLTYAASGFVNGETAAVLGGALSTTATASSGVGSYPITQGTLAAANYTLSFTGSTL